MPSVKTKGAGMRGTSGIFGRIVTRKSACGKATGWVMLVCCLTCGTPALARATPVLDNTNIQSIATGGDPGALMSVAPTESLSDGSVDENADAHYDDIRKYAAGFRATSHVIQIIDQNCNDSGLCLRAPWYLSFSSTAARWAYERRGAPDVLERIYQVSLTALATNAFDVAEARPDDGQSTSAPGKQGHAMTLAIAKPATAPHPPTPGILTVSQWVDLIASASSTSPNAGAGARLLAGADSGGDSQLAAGWSGMGESFDDGAPADPASSQAAHGVRQDGFLTRTVKSVVQFIRSIRDAVGI